MSQSSRNFPENKQIPHSQLSSRQKTHEAFVPEINFQKIHFLISVLADTDYPIHIRRENLLVKNIQFYEFEVDVRDARNLKFRITNGNLKGLFFSRQSNDRLFVVGRNFINNRVDYLPTMQEAMPMYRYFNPRYPTKKFTDDKVAAAIQHNLNLDEPIKGFKVVVKNNIQYYEFQPGDADFDDVVDYFTGTADEYPDGDSVDPDTDFSQDLQSMHCWRYFLIDGEHLFSIRKDHIDKVVRSMERKLFVDSFNTFFKNATANKKQSLAPVAEIKVEGAKP